MPSARTVSHRVTTVLFAAWLALAATAAAELDEIHDLIDRADWGAAETRLRAMVDVHPDYAYGHSLLGHVLMRGGRLAEAETSHRRAIDLAPDKYGYHHELARVRLRAKRFREAAEVLRRAPEPEDDATRRRRDVLLGRALAGAGDVDGAIAAFEAARGSTADGALDVALAERLATLYDERGRIEKALAVLDEAIVAVPSTRLLGRRVALALRHAAAAVDPDERKARYRRALVAADAALAEEPGRAELHNHAGRAALGAGDLERARVELTAVVEADPGQCYALTNLMKVEIAVTDWSAAEGWGRRAVACDGGLVHPQRQMGFVLEKQGRLEDSLVFYERALEIAPDAATVEAVERILHNLDAAEHNRRIDELEQEDRNREEEWRRRQQELRRKIEIWRRKHG